MDRFANVVSPQLARKNVFMITMHPGFAASEIAILKIKTAGLDGSAMVSMDYPARLLTYFAACENPSEYMGRIFWAERDLKALGIGLDAA
jgi:hypothetical protein